MALVLPRRLAPVLPTTYSPKDLFLAKAHTMYEHSGSPYHTFVHCRGFAPAAPRRAGTSISVSLSGLPLSRPLQIFGLVGRYPTNSLIRRRLILKHEFERNNIPVCFSYQVYTQFPEIIPDLRVDYRRVTEQSADLTI